MPRDIWDEYGYGRNPFEPLPLKATGEDAALFVGREQEVEDLATWFVSNRVGGIVVEGPIGVGKTTLVNIAQHRAYTHSKKKILPCLKTVETQDGMSPQSFLLEVLAHVLYSLERMQPKAAKDKEYASLQQAVERGVITSRGWQIQGSVLGTGGGVGYQPMHAVTQPAGLTMMTVNRYLERFRALAAAHGFDRIMVSINNLDIVNLAKFKGLIQAARDSSLALEGYLWAFIGPVGLRGELGETSLQRVSELLRGSPVELGPLSLAQVRRVISTRLKLHETRKTIQPVADEIVKFLYEASNGEIRYVLNRCGDIVEAVTAHLPTPTTVSLEKARWVLRAIVAPTIEQAALKPKEKDVLRRIAERRKVQGKEFKEYGFNQYQALFNHISSLAMKRLLVKERSGREVVYVPRGDVVLYFEANPIGAYL